MAKQMVEEDDTGRYWYADQYSNPSNSLAHELTTGPEIIEQTRGRITHFVAGLGTTGTCTGTGRALKRHRKGIQIVAVEPDAPFHGLEGLKHLGSSIVPAIFDDSIPDVRMGIDTERGWTMAEKLASEEGLAVGYSSGAAFAAALDVAGQLEEGVIVCIFCDHADRYIPPRRLADES
jgi:cysteine synthase B